MTTITAIETIFNGADVINTKLNDIIQLDDLQQRHKTDGDAIEAYTEAMKAKGVKGWEPVKLIELKEAHTLPDGSELEKGALLLVDGFQRTEAAVQANYDHFPAVIAQGTLDDAIKFSLIANKYNGVSLKGKDFQKAIKRLYALDSNWREHGKKKELALLFGCSEKTVQRAVSAIDKEIKEQAFNMFAEGATDKEVADFAHKSVATIKKWREEYDELQAATEEQETNEQQQEEQKGDDVDILNLTIENALKVTNPQVQAAILSILNDAFGAPQQTQDEPQQEQAQDDEPPFDTEPQGVNDDLPTSLAKEWKGKTPFEILGITKEKFESYQQKKAQLNRAYNKVLKRIHPDKFGQTEALDILMTALAEIKKTYKIK